MGLFCNVVAMHYAVEFLMVPLHVYVHVSNLKFATLDLDRILSLVYVYSLYLSK